MECTSESLGAVLRAFCPWGLVRQALNYILRGVRIGADRVKITLFLRGAERVHVPTVIANARKHIYILHKVACTCGRLACLQHMLCAHKCAYKMLLSPPHPNKCTTFCYLASLNFCSYVYQQSCIKVFGFARTHVHTRAHTHTHTHTHTHIHTHTHTHTHTQRPQNSANLQARKNFGSPCCLPHAHPTCCTLQAQWFMGCKGRRGARMAVGNWCHDLSWPGWTSYTQQPAEWMETWDLLTETRGCN